MLELSVAEQKLVDFALEEFGEALTQFLLTGLGEAETEAGRLFTITFINNKGTKKCRRVQIVADDCSGAQTSFPRQREPLVLLALLQHLITSHEVTCASLSYTYDEILGLLEWEDTSDSKLMIDGAVEHYFNLTYQPIMEQNELVERGLLSLTSKECLISGYSFHGDVAEEGQRRQANNRVEFNMSFVRELRQQSLFWIDWNRVCSVTPSK